MIAVQGRALVMVVSKSPRCRVLRAKQFALHTQNAPKRTISSEQGEFCTGSGAARLVQGEFCRRLRRRNQAPKHPPALRPYPRSVYTGTVASPAYSASPASASARSHAGVESLFCAVNHAEIFSRDVRPGVLADYHRVVTAPLNA